MSDLTNATPAPEEDDGFGGSIQTGRLIKGILARWTDTGGWKDRDGVALPSPVLIFGVLECLQCWKDKRPVTKADKPLADPDVLNAAIPQSEWEMGLDGKPKPSWAHVVGAYLVDPAGGGIFTYMSDTAGAHIAI